MGYISLGLLLFVKGIVNISSATSTWRVYWSLVWLQALRHERGGDGSVSVPWSLRIPQFWELYVLWVSYFVISCKNFLQPFAYYFVAQTFLLGEIQMLVFFWYVIGQRIMSPEFWHSVLFSISFCPSTNKWIYSDSLVVEMILQHHWSVLPWAIKYILPWGSVYFWLMWIICVS